MGNDDYSAESGETEMNGHEAVDRMATAAHETVDAAAMSAQHGVDRVEAAYQSMCDAPRSAIRSNPLGAVSLAFAIGYLFAKR